MNKILVFIAFILFVSELCFSQCSDDGVCFLGSRTEMSKENKSNVSFFYSNSGSGSPDNVKYNLFKLGGSLVLSKHFLISANLPYLIQKQDSVKISGFGDAIGILEYNLAVKNSNKIIFQAGAKVNTAKKEFKYFNAYGTNDVLIGISYFINNFNFGTAAQIPLDKYEDDDLTFDRGAEISGRIGYNNLISKLNYKIELLGIKRISKSVFTSKNQLGIVIPSYEVPESDFFQINITGAVTYPLSKTVNSELSFAVPLLKRKENSDLTKRAYTVQLGLTYNF